MQSLKPLVVGLGNPLMGDDGIGVRVSRELRERRIVDIRVVDGGTPGFGLLELLAEERLVVFVDAVDAALEPGSVFWVDPDTLFSETRKSSLHQINLTDALDLLGKAGTRATLKIIGVQPARVGPGLELSDILAARLNKIAAQAGEMIKLALTDTRAGFGES